MFCAFFTWMLILYAEFVVMRVILFYHSSMVYAVINGVIFQVSGEWRHCHFMNSLQWLSQPVTWIPTVEIKSLCLYSTWICRYLQIQKIKPWWSWMICWCCPGHGTLFLLLSFSWLTEYHCLWDMEHWTRSRGSDVDQSPHRECCGRTRESDSGWSHDAGRTSPPEPGSWRWHETLIWTPVLIWSLSRIYTRLLTMLLIAWVISFVAFWKRKFIDTCKLYCKFYLARKQNIIVKK